MNNSPARKLPAHEHSRYATVLFAQSVSPAAIDFDALNQSTSLAVERLSRGDLSGLHADLLELRSSLILLSAHWNAQSLRKDVAAGESLRMGQHSLNLLREAIRLLELQARLAQPKAPAVAIQVNQNSEGGGEVVVGDTP